MKALFYIFFTLLIFINAHVNAGGKNETHPHQNQHQNAFLVKTALTKEQIETLLKQYHEKNHLENPSQVEQTQLKAKKQKSKKNHEKEPTPENGATQGEIPKSEAEPSEQIENEAESVSFGIFDFFFDDNDDTEDPPEPDLEKKENETQITEKPENGEIPESAETAAENTAIENKETPVPENAETTPNENKEIPEKGEILESAETAAENSANENKENEQVTLLAKEESTKTTNTQCGMTISGFFSVILLTIAFGFFLVFATQPKKINKNYSKPLNGIKIGF